tara:strand:+ start:1251 stop:2798 length:1548 start_codon:yes stop_codon:yes gene_type:complete
MEMTKEILKGCVDDREISEPCLTGSIRSNRTICDDINDRIRVLENYDRDKKEKDSSVTAFCNDPFFYHKQLTQFETRCKNWSEYIYTFWIIGCLLYMPITDLIEFIDRNTPINFVEILFDSIPLFQYIFGALYYRSAHFRYFAFRKIADGKHYKNAPEKICLATIISAFLGGFLFLSFRFGKKYNGPTFDNIMGFLYGFYALPAMVNNIAVFFMVFTEHKRDLTRINYVVKSGRGSLATEIITEIENNFPSPKRERSQEQLRPVSSFEETKYTPREETEQDEEMAIGMVLDEPEPTLETTREVEMTRCFSNQGLRQRGEIARRNSIVDEKWLDINELIVEVNDFRYGLELSVNAFSNIFSSCTVLGFIGTAVMVVAKIKQIRRKEKPWDFDGEVHIFVAAGIWIILFTSFILIAGKVSHSRNRILESLKTPFYTQMFIARMPIFNTTGQIIRNTKQVNMNMNYETITTIEWNLLTTILNEEWREFNILGVNIIANMKKILLSSLTASIAALLRII